MSGSEALRRAVPFEFGSDDAPSARCWTARSPTSSQCRLPLIAY